MTDPDTPATTSTTTAPASTTPTTTTTTTTTNGPDRAVILDIPTDQVAEGGPVLEAGGGLLGMATVSSGGETVLPHMSTTPATPTTSTAPASTTTTSTASGTTTPATASTTSDSAHTDHPPSHPATQFQKTLCAVLLIAMTCVLLLITQGAVSRLNDTFTRETRVDWHAPDGVTLKSGPAAFWYDSDKGKLVYRGVVDDKHKFELINLLVSDNSDPAVGKSYWAAIDKLTYQSNDSGRIILINLLFLGGLSSLLGVQLRSLINFVGNACYTGNLDLFRWWPYYVIRPLTVFILGVILIAVVQGGYFTLGAGSPTSSLAWGGIAFLAGFGEQEFTQRLRQLTKTIFGEAK